MASTLYYQDYVTHVLDILRTNFATIFNAFYEGDPIAFPQSSLPAVVVYKESGAVDLGPTGFDRNDISLMIKVIVDKRQDIGASDSVDLSERRLRMLVEGREPTTGLYENGSILGALRTNFTLSETNALNPILEQKASIRYYVVDRGETISTEAWISFTITELLQIPNRA